MPAEIQHAVITGGTGSLGRAITSAFSDPAWSVASPGSRQLDVTDPSAVRSYFRDQPVDLLVCAAGITRDAPLVKLTESAWVETWAVNFSGAASCARAVLPSMLKRGAGHIIFISSFTALHPPPGQAAYAAAKSALLGLTTAMAREHGPQNIRVNAILPGFLDTPMTSGVTPHRRTEVLASHSLGRLNTCADAAAFIRFLHLHMPHTSGQIFQLDSRVPTS